MITRQFKRLAGLSKADRTRLAVEGLLNIGANVASLAKELEKCTSAGAFRAARLTYNVGREEAGKFLILIDAWRAPGAKQRVISRQFERAGIHLAKMIYAQIADYSISSQAELQRAVRSHRQGLYLDGPNDYDFIFRNDLLWERESAMYVDLVDSEGELEWWTPSDYAMAISVPYPMRLVTYLLGTELVSEYGLAVLSESWKGFDPHRDSRASEWTERTVKALSAFPDKNIKNGRLTKSASFIARQWPMPMVELEVEEEVVSLEKLQADRERAHDRWRRAEVGDIY